jgi:hypothetical protein
MVQTNMTQSLYDAQHGMSPEDLWSRYRQYPWRNNAGEMVMQNEPAGNWQGPGLPTDVAVARITPGVLGSTSPFPPHNITMSSLYNQGTTLQGLNHELQHKKQFTNGLPTGPVVDSSEKQSKSAVAQYFMHPGEEQARMAGHRSAMPQPWLDALHPFSSAYSDEDSGGDFKSSVVREGMINMFTQLIKAKKPNAPQNEIDEVIRKTLASKKPVDHSDEADARRNESFRDLQDFAYSEDMPKSQKILSRQMAPTLMELLMQGRERYVPPFISQGMQK